MVTWSDAHRIASIAAAHAHHDFGVDTGAPPIDVAAAVAAAGLPLMWRPMPRLFGAYLCGPGLRPGILLNSSVPVGARRHTAAHELGHHCLHHAVATDYGACLQLDLSEDFASAEPVRHRWTDAERTAEAFAAWFLMPRKAVLAAIDRLGLTRLESASDVYRASLILGISYRSMVRHLPNLRLASRDRARAWMAVAPGRVKSQLNPAGDWRARGTADLWIIDRLFDGAQVRLQYGDQLVVVTESGARAVANEDACLASESSGDFPTGEAWRAWIATGCQGDDSHGVVSVESMTPTGIAGWSVSVVVEPSPAGLDRHWKTRMERTR